MKRIGFLLLTFIFLAGCGTRLEPRETVGSCMELPSSTSQPRYTISMPMPEEVREVLGPELWESPDTAIFCQTLQAPSLSALLRELTGRDDLVPLLSRQDGLPRYDLAWTVCGEGGQEIWRCAVIDDGTFYYCACAGVPEEAARDLRQRLEQCFSHLRLQDAMGLSA